MGGKNKAQFQSVPWSTIHGFDKSNGIRERQKKPFWKRYRIQVVLLNPRLARWFSSTVSADVVVASTYVAQQAMNHSSSP